MIDLAWKIFGWLVFATLLVIGIWFGLAIMGVARIGAAESGSPRWPPCSIVMLDARGAAVIDWPCTEIWAAEGSSRAEDTELGRLLVARRDQLIKR